MSDCLVALDECTDETAFGGTFGGATEPPAAVSLFPVVGGFNPALGTLQGFTSNAPELANGGGDMANGAGELGIPVPQVLPVEDPMTGIDIRDLEMATGALGLPGAVGGLPAVGGGVALATQFLRAIMGNATRITRNHWDQLPGWARTALAAVGLGIGVELAQGLPGVPGDPFGIGGNGGPHISPHLVDGHLGDHVVGGWVANGVRFYRLSSGKLAVQNKRGRWKVWMPKKPIVIMPGGTKNLRTLLRADAVITKQAKQLQNMLNRRAPRAKRSAPQQKVVVVEAHSRMLPGPGAL